MFWSKHPKDHITSNKERDIKVRAHQLHMKNAEAQAEVTEKSAAEIVAPDAKEGLDPGIANKVGRGKQVAREMVHQHAKELGKMQTRVRASRSKARARGRSLGF